MAEETPSSEQVVAGTALERELARVTESFDNFKVDLIASGVSEEMIKAAREHVLARKQAEYKKRQEQDPFVLIGNALKNAAQSEEEQALANFGISGFEYYRNKWQSEFRESQIAYSRSGGEGSLDIRSFLRDMRTFGRHGEAGAVVMQVKARKPLKVPGNETEIIVPSKEFQVRILRNLGVLSPDETLDTLRAIPERPKEPDGPYSEVLTFGGEEKIYNLPTNIDGVKTHVTLGQKHPMITVFLNESAFGRVLKNPSTPAGAN